MKEQPTWIEVRERRLRSDHKRMLELTEGNELIAIEKTEGDPPESYTIRFHCRGVVRVNGARPVYGDVHRVDISLPVQYPTRPPQMRWLTQIFHPNINAEGTYVCVDVWYPSKFLDDLCIMLGRMIQFKNYNPSNPLRLDAAMWSLDNKALFPVDQRPLRPGTAASAESDEIDIRFV